MDKNSKFQFPKTLLRQLSECSNGFMLFVIDENGEIQLHEDPNINPVQYLGLVNFLEIYSASLQATLRGDVVEGGEEE